MLGVSRLVGDPTTSAFAHPARQPDRLDRKGHSDREVMAREPVQGHR